MLKSIQWTLQLWHAGLMALVLVGFGTFTYVGYRQIRLAQVKADLDHTAQVVMSLTISVAIRGVRSSVVFATTSVMLAAMRGCVEAITDRSEMPFQKLSTGIEGPNRRHR